MTNSPTLSDYYLASALSYEKIDEIEQAGLAGYELIQKRSGNEGFQAIALKHKSGGFILIAFRGTLIKFSAPAAYDLYDDALIFVNEVPPQYTLGNDFVSLVMTRSRLPIFLTGHSLGGGIAQYVFNNNANNNFIVGGYTFAGPGQQTFKPSITSNMIDLVNRNDPIGNYHLRHHAGDVKLIDHRYSSFQVDTLLGLPKHRAFGANFVSHPVEKMSRDSADRWLAVKGSFSFLMARLLVFHHIDNYGALLNYSILPTPDPRLPTCRPAGLTQLAAAYKQVWSNIKYVSEWGHPITVFAMPSPDVEVGIMVVKGTLHFERYIEIEIIRLQSKKSGLNPAFGFVDP